MSYLIMLGNFPYIMFPMYETNRWVALYFIAFVLLGNVLLFNFLQSVLYYSYQTQMQVKTMMILQYPCLRRYLKLYNDNIHMSINQVKHMVENHMRSTFRRTVSKRRESTRATQVTRLLDRAQRTSLGRAYTSLRNPETICGILSGFSFTLEVVYLVLLDDGGHARPDSVLAYSLVGV